jgi:hypothetical protein
MRISRSDLAALGRRRQQPVKAADELLAVFVGGKLINTKNARLHWRAESAYKHDWRERVAVALLACGWKQLRVPPAAPKRVTFIASTGGEMDGDGLQVAIAPVRDALIQCGVIDGDADRHKHTFHYLQQIDKVNRGIEIRVRLKEPASEEGT